MTQYRVRGREHEELLLDLLGARGVMGDDVARFLGPDFERDSHDPFLLPDMGVAVERLEAAKKNNEHVAVWSDYDCDGIPGGVMLTEFFRSLPAGRQGLDRLNVTHYIPHRHEEGYGLNDAGLDELSAQGVTLIVTVDLGTTDFEPIAHAKSLGIDIIVTDHHIVSVLPPALAVVNPKRPDSRYPFDGLCGAGVAWKLVQAILSKHRPEGFAEGQEKWFLDLVGIATLSDMVPLVGENRMLAHFGLRVMRKNRRPGLVALLELLRIKAQWLTEDDIGFMVAPRINAASRMGSPHVAARLLATTEKEEAETLAHALNKINDERKGAVAMTVKEVNKRLAGSGFEKSPLIVMGNPDWRPGVLGLVANSLVEAHGKPVFLWGRDGSTGSPQGDGLVRGSCRSRGGINVVSLMHHAREMFDNFGGHHASGGFSLSQGRVHELAPALMRAFESLAAEASIEQEVMIDRELSIAELPFAKRTLDKLAPFGEGNRKPLFLFSRVAVKGVRTFGKTQNHLELTLAKDTETALGVSFFSTSESFEKPLAAGNTADIVGHVENDWRGRPRIRIVDML